MELSKNDVKMTKGLAIIFMVLLHLFCAKENLAFSPMIYIGSVPLVYYLALFGDCCVVIYSFCSGYAHRIIYEEKQDPYKIVLKRLPTFMIQFWVVCLLAILAGVVTGNENIPGTASDIMGNLFFYRMSYNGAWWFIVTYIILCIFFPIFMKLVDKNVVLATILFGVIYTISHLVRFGKIDIPLSGVVFEKIEGILAPSGMAMLPYVAGAIFRKLKIFSWLRAFTDKCKPWMKNLFLIMFIVGMFFAHCIIQTLFVAIFTGIGTVICFNLLDKGKLLSKFFEYLGTHSTNIWLTHMFFFDVLFDGLIYKVKYPVPIFAFMLVLVIPLSMFINFTMKQLNEKTILKKLK